MFSPAVDTANRSHRAGIIAAAAAGLFVMALATRLQSTADLGYHLAYGDVLLDTGRIVDDASFVHPAPQAADLHAQLNPPGSWFDADGHYHFVNENWLSQAVMSAVHRIGGGVGLSLLAAVLVGAILVAQAVMLRQGGLSWLAVAVAWLLTGSVAYDRFNLRPELFSYALLALQLCLLTAPLSRKRIIGLLAVQMLLANVHSYWPLGIALVGCLFAGRVVVWLLFKSTREQTGVGMARLAFVLAGVIVVTIIHPAGLGHVVMPFQTLAYLERYDIVGRSAMTMRQLMAGEHPWATIGEFRAFWPGVGQALGPLMFVVLMALALVASIALLIARRWGLVLICGLFVAVGLGMRRNIAPAAVVLGPVVVLGLWIIVQKVVATASTQWQKASIITAMIVFVAVSVVGIEQVISQRLYVRERVPWKFGLGMDDAHLFLDFGRWLDSHMTQARPAYTNFDASSNVLYCSSKISGVPMLTNTWAQPPQRMWNVLMLGLVPHEANEKLEQWGIGMVVLPYHAQTTHGLIVRLDRSPDWHPIWVGPLAVAFARDDVLGAEPSLRPVVESDIDYAALHAQALAADPVGRTALPDLAGIVEALGWYKQAVDAWTDVLNGEPDSIRAHKHLSYCLTQLALRYRSQGRDDWRQLGERAKQLDLIISELEAAQH